MDSAASPFFVVFIALLTFGVVFVCVTLQASVRNAAPPAISRTKLYLAATMVTVLFISASCYTAYIMRRTASSATVDPPKPPPDVPGRAR
jgi:hypothetical protein